MRRVPSLILVVVLAGAAGCAHVRPQPCPCPPEARRYWRIPCEWLQRIETPAEAAAAHTVDGVPFGALHDQWVNLLSQMQPGDVLWSYSGSYDCPPGEKCFRRGEDGVVLLRGCAALRWLPTAATYKR